jgi:Virulence factor BrkB
MLWTVIKCTVDQWFQHRSARLGAALAYYSVFSMGPLLLIVTSIAGLLFGADAVRGSLGAQFRTLLGETGSKAVEAMLAGASSPQSGRLAATQRHAPFRALARRILIGEESWCALTWVSSRQCDRPHRDMVMHLLLLGRHTDGASRLATNWPASRSF